jgi:hypothetical protein
MTAIAASLLIAIPGSAWPNPERSEWATLDKLVRKNRAAATHRPLRKRKQISMTTPANRPNDAHPRTTRTRGDITTRVS